MLRYFRFVFVILILSNELALCETPLIREGLVRTFQINTHSVITVAPLWSGKDPYLTAIEVSRDGDVIQILENIDRLGDMFLERWGDNPNLIGVEDFNFDGDGDLKVLTNTGTAGSRFAIFLFDPRLRKFKFNEELSALSSPVSNPKAKTISTSSSDGGGASFWEKTYNLKGGRLKLVSAVQQEFARATKTYDRKVEKHSRLLCHIQFKELEDGSVREKLLAGRRRLCGRFP